MYIPEKTLIRIYERNVHFMAPNAQFRFSDNSAISAISVQDSISTVSDALKETEEKLMKEINTMKKEFEELRNDCIPESTRRIRIMRELEFFKDDSSEELPTLKTPDTIESFEDDECDEYDLGYDAFDDLEEIPFNPDNFSTDVGED